MLESIRNSNKISLRMLLVLLMLQSVFVAFEFTEEIGHILENSDFHHSSFAVNQDSPLSSLDASHSNKPLTTDTSKVEVNDHCCHCHGHGFYTAVLNNESAPFIPLMKHERAHGHQTFTCGFANNIYRPPIA